MTRSSRRRLPRVLAAPVVAGSLFLCSDLFPRLSLTTYTGRALNWSIAMDQSLGLLLGTSARAQPAAPAKPTVESGDSTLTVSWKQPEGYPDSQTIQYDIEYSEDGSSIWRPWYIPSQLKNLEVKIPGLKNGTTYSVRVRARDGDVYGQWSALEKAMPVGVPSAPTQLNVIPGDQNLKLSWVAPVDLAGSEIKDYEVEYSSDSGETQTLWNEASKSTTLSDQITNLKNGTTYHLRVRAINKMGHGPWSDWAMGQPATVPAAPNKPTLTQKDHQLEVNWDAPSNDGGAPISGYDIQYSSDQESTRILQVPADSQQPLTIAGLSSGTTYAVQVRARNDQGDGEWSDPSSKQLLGVPVAPGRPILKPGNRKLYVTWDAPNDNDDTPISGYDLQYSSDDGSTWKEWDGSIDSQSREATITGLQNSVTYNVRVRARNSQGDGPWSISALDRPAGTPGAPTQLTLTPHHHELQVSWDRPADNGGAPIASYDIQYKSDHDSNWRPWHTSLKLDNLTTNISNLDKEITYTVRVRARNSQGDGLWSALAHAKPVGFPAAPTKLDLTSGDQKLDLNWVAPVDDGGSEIVNYDIQYSDDHGSTWSQWNASVNSQRLQETITGLQNGTVYRVQVRAGNSQGNGPWSVWEEGQPATTPAAPASPTLIPGNRELHVNWNAPDNDGGDQITGYDVQYTADDNSTWREWHTSADVQNSLQTTIASLDNGTTYAVQVRARNDQGPGPWSASVRSKPVGIPNAPLTPTLKPGNRKLHVKWDAPNDNGGTPISDYDLQYSSDDGATWKKWDGSIDSQNREATITGLQNDVTYHIQVRAKNSEGNGPWSTQAEGQPRLLPKFFMLSLSILIWPIILTIIARYVDSYFKINIRKIIKDRFSSLR